MKILKRLKIQEIGMQRDWVKKLPNEIIVLEEPHLYVITHKILVGKEEFKALGYHPYYDVGSLIDQQYVTVNYGALDEYLKETEF